MSNPGDFNLPTDYIFAENSWGNIFYKVYTTELNYNDAKAQCESDGAFLAIPRSQAENDFFFGLMSNSFWIGINDIEQEGSFVAVDGQGVSWTNWVTGYPDGGGDGVFASWVDGRWYDRDPLDKFDFICSIDIAGIIFPFELYRPCLSQERPGFKLSFSKMILRHYNDYYDYYDNACSDGNI